MRFLFIVYGFLFMVGEISSQPVSSRLQKAYKQFENDEQLKHAISSLYVIDAKTGEVVFNKNSRIGLAPASTQKIITATTAFELLGKDFRYKTEFSISDSTINNKRYSPFYISGYGDPTFGSWRYHSTKGENIFTKLADKINQEQVAIEDRIVLYEGTSFTSQSIPNGWIWEDIGNYYGAGAQVFNWNENQFDMYLRSGPRIGDPVKIIKVEPEEGFVNFSELTSAEKNSGDNAYIYFSGNSDHRIVRGTIPVNEANFKISGSLLRPGKVFLRELVDFLEKRVKIGSEAKYNKVTVRVDTELGNSLYNKRKTFFTHFSPSLDSIVYWLLKKSVNLYGEALVKTFAYEKQGFGSTDSGLAIVKKFWKEKGIDEDELNIYDGSGLSPLNRVTTHAQVGILKYARSKEWFPYFLDGFPEYNGMKMKSGTISDAKGYCGYHKAKDGREYIFSFLVNNYSGRASALVSKMFKVLDELK